MRLAVFAFGVVTALASGAPAFEVEDFRSYPADGTATLRILSTADLDVFEPFILGFQAQEPEIAIEYTVASSKEVFSAIRSEAAFDLVLSSAMDLQFQLANDGYATTYTSEATASLPAWAQWRNMVFAFTAESAVAVISEEHFADLTPPTTREGLIQMLRAAPERFDGKVGTYDIRSSGLGYLFATQEARISDTYWRLAEVMGQLDTDVFCCSGQMIDAVAAGELAIAYNVLGSYAAQRLQEDDAAGLRIIEFEDYSNVMLRTALIPTTAQNGDAAGRFLDRLLFEGLRDSGGAGTLPPLVNASVDGGSTFGPIRLGPALMVYLDPLNRAGFLESWENSVINR
ncbi:MAG: ABC transporter substrate-binding protein [Pseudomonadota bacterium]